MSVIGISEEDQLSVLNCVAAILHIGNIQFSEQGNYAVVAEEDCRFIIIIICFSFFFFFKAAYC